MFGGLFGKGKKKDHSIAEKLPALTSAVSSSILNAIGSRSIPSMPAAAHRAFQLATDPNAESRDFVEVIEADEALSARVIKIANSVYYDRGKRTSTIEDAVIVIGIEELRGLLNANTLCEIFPSRQPARTWIWSHDIATALIARNLSQRLSAGKAATAFLAGLMHDLGKLLLLQRASEEYSTVIKTVENTGVIFSTAEEQIFPFDHTEVGQLIGEQWKFSAELIQAIRSHHQPWSEWAGCPGPLPLPAIVRAADAIAHALGLGHPPSFAKLRLHFEESLGDVWLALGIPDAEQKPLLQGFRRSFELEYDLYSGNPSR